MKRTWQDIPEIARDLREQYPEQDPLDLSLDVIRGLVVALATFDDRSDVAGSQTLSAIQSAWYEEYEQ